MTDEQVLDALLQELLAESEETQKMQVPVDYAGKRNLLRALMNIRPPRPVGAGVLAMQDQILSSEREAKTLTDPYSLPTLKDEFEQFDFPLSERLVLWKGDITSLKAGAIVNAANSKLLGCFHPLHKCIDNVIHSAAGMQLRLECHEIMEKQGYDEPVGQAKITGAYNLPCKYVLHTVGPMIEGEVTDQDVSLLKSCYTACLDLARDHLDIRSLAFCCISTGVFRFPKPLAARVAVSSVCQWLQETPGSIDRVIFNVFTQDDYDEYSVLFRQGFIKS